MEKKSLLIFGGHLVGTKLHSKLNSLSYWEINECFCFGFSTAEEVRKLVGGTYL